MFLRSRRSALRATALIGVIGLACAAIAISTWQPEPLPAADATPIAPGATPSIAHAMPTATTAVNAVDPVTPDTEKASISTPSPVLSARDRGYALIAEWQQAGEFERAADYATAEAGENRRDFLIAAFHEWARQKPELAFTTATRVADPAAREIAVQAALSGWARSDPQGLAELAVDRPDGPEKTAALTKALREWVHQDPFKAGDWIAAHESTIPVVEKMFRDDRR